MFPKKAVNDENQGGHTAVSKTPIRPKKGIAVKKAPKKTKPRWVETDSEGEEGYEKGSKRAQRAGTVAKESQTKARATQTQGRLAKSGAIQKKSKTATGASKRVRFDIPEAFDEL